LPKGVPDGAQGHRILVENPATLFGFPRTDASDPAP
jgi:hypothetical protein